MSTGTWHLPPEQLAEVGDRDLVNRNGGVSQAPGVWLGENFKHVKDPAPGSPECYKTYINHYVTPEKHNTCHYWYSITTEYTKPDPEAEVMFKAFVGAAFEEDVVAVKFMQEVFNDDTTDHDEININGDKAAVLFRRKTLEWALQEYPELANYWWK